MSEYLIYLGDFMSTKNVGLTGTLLCCLVLVPLIAGPAHATTSGGIDSTTPTMPIAVSGQEGIELDAPGSTLGGTYGLIKFLFPTTMIDAATMAGGANITNGALLNFLLKVSSQQVNVCRLVKRMTTRNLLCCHRANWLSFGMGHNRMKRG